MDTDEKPDSLDGAVEEASSERDPENRWWYVKPTVVSFYDNGDARCQVDLNSRDVYVRFPKDVVQSLQLQNGSKFVWYPQDLDYIRLGDCALKPITPSKAEIEAERAEVLRLLEDPGVIDYFNRE